MKRFAPSRCASFSQDCAGIVFGLRAPDAMKHTSTRAGRNSRQVRFAIVVSQLLPFVHRDLLLFLFTADCQPRDLTENAVAGDESWHIETVARRDTNKKASEQAEKATDSEPVKGKELLESEELKRKLSKAEERYRSGLSPKKAKSESR